MLMYTIDLDVPSLTLRANLQHGPHVHIARLRRDGPRFEASNAVPISRSKTTGAFFFQVSIMEDLQIALSVGPFFWCIGMVTTWF